MRKYVSWIVVFAVGVASALVGQRVATDGLRFWKNPPELPTGSVREDNLPAGTLAGLTESQKYRVLKGVSERFGPGRAQRLKEDPKAVYHVPVEDSPSRGPADALVTIVESSDFQCPFCKRVLPTLKQIEAAYPGKARFVFKQNPLPFHANALEAALAAEEARAQGGDAKFWPLHDKLFEAPALDRASVERAAREVGLDLNLLRTALDTTKHVDRIRRDQGLMSSLGAGGTPMFFINGRKLAGAQTFEAFKALVDEELAKAEELVKSGVAAKDVYARVIEKGAAAPVMVAGGTPPPAPNAPAPAASPPAMPLAPGALPIRPDDPAKGDRRAPVQIVVFSDFQCPFCGRAEATVRDVEKAYGKRVRVVWKHAPLPFHANAVPAALAAEAAREQGKFWQMHDKLFENQTALSPVGYERWAKEIGLDMDRFHASLQSSKARARIEEDQGLAKRTGVTGTPTFFVNGERLVGAAPLEQFKVVIDRQFARVVHR